MSPVDLVTIRNRQPFEPFRLVMADGRQYDVRHPELLIVGQSTSMLGMAVKEEGPFVLADHYVYIDNPSVTTLIPLSVADQLG